MLEDLRSDRWNSCKALCESINVYNHGVLMKKLEVETRKTLEVHRQSDLAHEVEIQQRHCLKQN